MSEPYAALAHLALNVERPRTEWLNMGDWSRARTFPDACAALTRRLHDAARLPPHARLLDVGHGCGDSLLLLLDERAPHTLHGVTSLAAHAQRAQARTGDRATVHCADAVAWLAQTPHTYDAVLALDCAYHFADRPAFFRAAHAALAPRGTLALVDLVAAHPYPTDAAFGASSLPAPTHPPRAWARAKHRVACALSGTPPQSFVSIDTYRTQLADAGFAPDAVEATDISADVFPGFAHFLTHLGTGDERVWRAGSSLQLYALRLFGRVVAQWARGGNTGLVRCVLVVATKR